jgi:hypothetical protein
MNTVLFAQARHAAETRGNFLKRIDENHPAHPSKFRFASDRDRREYERELRGETMPGCLKQMLLVTGPRGAGKTALIKALLSLKYGEKVPVASSGINETWRFRSIETAIRAGADYVWLEDIAGGRKSFTLKYYSTVSRAGFRNPGTNQSAWFEKTPQIYLSGSEVSLSEDLLRRTRVIKLAPAPDL